MIKRRNFFQIATLLFFILSIVAGLVLVQQEQDPRNLAQYEGCTCVHTCPTNGGCYEVSCPGKPNEVINGGPNNCPANNSGGSVSNPSASSWTCQVCTCTSLTDGQCRSNCTMMPCSQAKTPSCGQVNACPPGQPTSQCGASSENRSMGTNCPNNNSNPTPKPTTPPTSATPPVCTGLSITSSDGSQVPQSNGKYIIKQGSKYNFTISGTQTPKADRNAGIGIYKTGQTCTSPNQIYWTAASYTNNKDSLGKTVKNGDEFPYTFSWTANTVGDYTVDGRIWDDGRSETRGNCAASQSPEKDSTFGGTYSENCKVFLTAVAATPPVCTGLTIRKSDGSVVPQSNGKYIINQGTTYRFTISGTQSPIVDRNAGIGIYKTGQTCTSPNQIYWTAASYTNNKDSLGKTVKNGDEFPYTFSWTANTVGDYTVDGRIWDDGRSETRGNCAASQSPEKDSTFGGTYSPDCKVFLTTQVAPTSTPAPLPTTTPKPPTSTPAPIPRSCGQTCSSSQLCSNDFICVLARNGQSYCTKPEYEQMCVISPNSTSCCVAPTSTPTPIPTNTPTPTPTPVPMSCGASCATSGCSSGLVCILAGNSRSYCSKPEYENRCSSLPGYDSCCVAPTSTPRPNSTPTPTSTPRPTNTPTPTLTPRPTNTPAAVVLSCGQTGCDLYGQSCASNLICIKTNAGTYRCGKEELEPTCKEKNTTTSCCVLPTNTLAPKEPTPTKIILPVTGFDLPLKGMTIVGTVVTLLGVLLLL